MYSNPFLLQLQNMQAQLAQMQQSALANAQDIANNSAQSAHILSQLGKFVPNAPAAATT